MLDAQLSVYNSEVDPSSPKNTFEILIFLDNFQVQSAKLNAAKKKDDSVWNFFLGSIKKNVFIKKNMSVNFEI